MCRIASPDSHATTAWIPAFAGMTVCLSEGVTQRFESQPFAPLFRKLL